MSDPAKHTPPPDANETQIDAALAEFGGDPRAAIGALLHDLTLIIEDAQVAVSHGYVRGRLLVFRCPVARSDEASSSTSAQRPRRRTRGPSCAAGGARPLPLGRHRPDGAGEARRAALLFRRHGDRRHRCFSPDVDGRAGLFRAGAA